MFASDARNAASASKRRTKSEVSGFANIRSTRWFSGDTLHTLPRAFTSNPNLRCWITTPSGWTKLASTW